MSDASHAWRVVARRSCAESLDGPRKDVRVTNTTNNGTSTAAKAGIGFGTALAITISWSANKSILWAILHGVLGWFYVVYYAIRY